MLSHADLTVERWPGTQLTEEDEEIPHLQPTETFVQSSHALMQCMTGKEQAVLFKASSVAIMSSLGLGRREEQAKAGYRLGCSGNSWASQDWQHSLAERLTQLLPDMFEVMKSMLTFFLPQ